MNPDFGPDPVNLLSGYEYGDHSSRPRIRVGPGHIRQQLQKILKDALGDEEWYRLSESTGWYDPTEMVKANGLPTWSLRTEALERPIFDDDDGVQRAIDDARAAFAASNLIVGTWDEIENCRRDGLRIPESLERACDASKRSREYINAKESPGDMGAGYFATAAPESK